MENQDKINDQEELDHLMNDPEEVADSTEVASDPVGQFSATDQTEQDGMVQKDNEIIELKDKYLRLYAEFENHKRRTIREKLDLMKTAAQDTMTALLPVLDDFDRAQNSIEGLSEGIHLIYQKLNNTLKNLGLESMESTGEVFNPELHNAITEILAPNPELAGKIVDTVEKGYLLSGKIIRHAKVVVGK